MPPSAGEPIIDSLITALKPSIGRSHRRWTDHGPYAPFGEKRKGSSLGSQAALMLTSPWGRRRGTIPAGELVLASLASANCDPDRFGEPDKIAVAGHSLGGHTASLLLGARSADPDTGEVVNLPEPRIQAGVLLAAPGRGGDILNRPMAELVPFFHTTRFSTMTTPTLIVAGDQDDPALHLRRPPVARRPLPPRPPPKTLLTCPAPSTCSAASPDTTPPRPPTRTPSGSPPSRASPRPTCAPSSSPTTTPGRRRARCSRPGPTRPGKSSPSRQPRRSPTAGGPHRCRRHRRHRGPGRARPAQGRRRATSSRRTTAFPNSHRSRGYPSSSLSVSGGRVKA